jgi:hypothetical protein
VWCLWTPVKVMFLSMFNDTKAGSNLCHINITHYVALPSS